MSRATAHKGHVSRFPWVPFYIQVWLYIFTI